MTNPTPAAILALLAISERAPLPRDEAAEAWLSENALIALNEAQILDLTEKGTVWLGMLGATPLPIEVPLPRWTDPRSAPVIHQDAVVRVGMEPGGLRAADWNEPAKPAPSFELPPGYNPNRFTTLPPGQIPLGMQRDADIETIWRNGRKVKNYAGSIIWQHRDKPDDVMAYRVIAGEQLLVSGTALTA